MMVVMRVAAAEALWGMVPEWHEQAACRGHGDLYFPPEDADRAEIAAAYDICRAICGSCPVVDACRADVDRRRDPTGFYAGESPTMRLRRWRTGREGTPAQVARRRRVLELRSAGRTLSEIAREVGVTVTTVAKDAAALDRQRVA